MKWLAVLGCVVLVGCVNTSSPEFIKKTEEACASYGFKPGSDQMANCRMSLAQIQEQKSDRTAREVGQALSDVGDDMAANHQRQLDRDAYIAAHRQPTR